MLAFGMPGMTEWVIILVIVLIFFGPGKLPDVFKKAGQGIKAFKDASEGKGKGAVDEEDEASEDVVVRTSKKTPAQIEEKDELDDDAEGETAPVSRSTKSRKG